MLKSPYINLAIIKRDAYFQEERDEFTKQTLHGGIDQILEHKAPITTEDILAPEKAPSSKRHTDFSRSPYHERMRSDSLEESIELHNDFIQSKEPTSLQDMFLLEVAHSKRKPHSSICDDDQNEERVKRESSSSTKLAKANQKPVSFVLMEGPPGIDKTTLTWEICRKWDEILYLVDYLIVLLIKLREKWVLNAKALSDLFRFPYHP